MAREERDNATSQTSALVDNLKVSLHLTDAIQQATGRIHQQNFRTVINLNPRANFRRHGNVCHGHDVDNLACLLVVTELY